MRIIYLFSFCILLLCACNNEKTNTTTSTSTTTPSTEAISVSKPVAAVPANGKASASTLQNLSTGFWHIGGAVNTTEGGKRYDGEWLQFTKEQTYVYGKDEKEMASGTWIFDEKNEYITLKGKPGEEAFYLHEFQCKQIGDIVLLLGNTPNNERGTQIKLVRQDTKTIEHNPN